MYDVFMVMCVVRKRMEPDLPRDSRKFFKMKGTTRDKKARARFLADLPLDKILLNFSLEN